MTPQERAARALGPRPGARVEVIGPCPGCGSWQVDIADDVPAAASRVGFVSRLPTPDDLGAVVSELAAAVAAARRAMIEEALEEHAAECAPLRARIEELGVGSGA